MDGNVDNTAKGSSGEIFPYIGLCAIKDMNYFGNI